MSLADGADSPGIHYQAGGEGRQTVLLVHGLPSSLHEWQPMAQNLAAEGYRTLALDLPGHGASMKPDPISAYSADAFYALFEAWLEDLALEPSPVLMGHSFGGYLCLRYALEHGGKVGGLVLIDPFLAYGQMTAISRLGLAQPQIAAYLLKRAPLRLIQPVLWAGSLMRSGAHIHSFFSKSELQQTALDFKRCSPNIAYIPHTVGDLTPALDQLCVPTLLMWGKHDRTLSPAWYEKLVSNFPKVRSQALKAGHNPHLSNFQEVIQPVLEFMKSIFAG